uniref:hypothetical protein n=1 Tax=Pedobacter schmidteae TaxID=2201271 RepID=UPI000EB359B3|nr:hypothetical protein [Pedobacter schmidteae]
MRKILYAVALVASVMLASCSKKDAQPGPDKSREAITKLQKDILGKWVFSNTVFPKTSAAKGQANARVGDVLPSAGKFARTSYTANVVAKTGFIEFLKNNTYLVYDADGNYFTGTFDVRDGQTIDLAGFGTINEIKFTQEKIDFIVNYTAQNKKLTISANRAVSIPLTERTELLTGKIWSVTGEEKGQATFFNAPIDIQNSQDGSILLTSWVDKITFLFSSSGTYSIHFYYQNKLLAVNMFNWKWHSTDANKLVYWGYSETVDEDQFEVIREITKDVLRWSNFDDGKEAKYVMRPAQ